MEYHREKLINNEGYFNVNNQLLICLCFVFLKNYLVLLEVHRRRITVITYIGDYLGIIEIYLGIKYHNLLSNNHPLPESC